TTYKLPDQPFGFGRPCTDRAYWDAIRNTGENKFSTYKRWAEASLTSGIAPWDEAKYRAYVKTGIREGETMMRARYGPITSPVLAMEGKGRYILYIEQALQEYCSDPTWASQVSDRTLGNYGNDPTKYLVEMSAAQFGAELSQIYFLLGSQLSKPTMDLLLRRINERVLIPVLAALDGKNRLTWLNVTTNVNPVCWNGVVYTALATPILSWQNKDRIVKAAVSAVPAYMKSFSDEGFGTEGVWYFNFGFGPFSVMRELLAQATNNGLDLFADKRAAFADSHFTQRFRAPLLDYLKWAYGQDVCPGTPGPSTSIPSLVLQFVINTHGLEARPVPFQVQSLDPSPLRTVFKKADTVVMRGRPATEESNRNRLDLRIKGGGNGPHSHNDLGSYAIALDGVVVVGDPGGPPYYDANSFNDMRYKSPLLSSYGHPVPLVGGKVQEEAVGVLKAGGPLPTGFSASDKEDRFIVDLQRAYKGVDKLRRVRRVAKLIRDGKGKVVIQDRVLYSSVAGTAGRLWETALTTYGNVTVNARRDGGTIVARDSDGKEVTAAFAVTSAGGKVVLDMRELESYSLKWKRLGIKMMATKKESWIAVTITPA
ncbi:hypothetical protein HDU96_003161, partial [Phlyctochytrium bullatum]